MNKDSNKPEGIYVAIRIRPLNERELTSGEKSCASVPVSNCVCLNKDNFSYDKVFDVQANNEAVYSTVAKSIVQNVMRGINGTIFAYGQTSSGKTHTMLGGGNERGVLELAAEDIFSIISQNTSRLYLMRTSFVEIYNENVRDLLADSDATAVQIREDPRKGVYMETTELRISDYESILKTLKKGINRRAVESTAMNDTSSRSHTIFRIIIESRESEAEADGAILVSSLNLVDLAGSESVRHTGAVGQRAKEGGNINKSLLSLSRVIHSLSQPGQHVSFRDSKLTRILQPSLSGNAKMAIICCITPSERYLEETRSTLQFASRAKLVTTNAVVNEVLDDTTKLKRLEKQVQDLNKENELIKNQNDRLRRAMFSGDGNKTSRASFATESIEVYVDDEIEFTSRRKKQRGTWCPGSSARAAVLSGFGANHVSMELDNSQSNISVASDISRLSTESSQLEEAQLKIRELEDVISSLQSSATTSESASDESKSAASTTELQNYATTLEEELRKKTAQFDLIEETYKQKLEMFEEEVKRLTEDNDSLILEKDQIFQQLEIEMGANSEHEKEVESKMSCLVEENTLLSERIMELEQQMHSVSATSNADAFENLRAELFAKDNEIVSLREDNDILREGMESKMRALEQCNRELEMLRTQCSDQLEKLTEFDTENKCLVKQVSDLTSKLAVLEQHGDSRELEVVAETGNVNELKDHIALLEEDLRVSSEFTDMLMNQMEELKASKAEIEAELANAESELLRYATAPALVSAPAATHSAPSTECDIDDEVVIGHSSTSALSDAEDDDENDTVETHNSRVAQLQQKNLVIEADDETDDVDGDDETVDNDVTMTTESMIDEDKLSLIMVVKELESKLESAETERLQKENELVRVKDELQVAYDELSAALQTTTEQYESACSRNNQLQMEVDNLVESIKHVEEEKAMANAKLMELSVSLDEQSAQKELIQSELKSMQERFEEQVQHHTAQLNNLQKQLVDVTEQNSQLSQLTVDKSCEIERLVSEIASQSELVLSLERVVGDLEAKVAEYEVSEQQLSQQLLELSEKNDELSEMKTEVESIRHVEEEKAMANAKLIELSASLDEQSAQKELIQSELKSMQERFEEQVQHHTTQLNNLQKQLVDVTEQNSQLSQLTVDKSCEIERLVSEIASQSELVLSLERVVGDLEAKVAEYEVSEQQLSQQLLELSEKNDELSEMKTEAEAAKQLVSSLRQQLAQLQKQLEEEIDAETANEEKAAEVAQEADALREELASANQLCGQLQEALSAKEMSVIDIQKQLNEKEDIVALIENELFAAKQELALVANASLSISSEELEQLQEQLKSSREEIVLLQQAEEELKSELGKAHQLCDELQASLSTKESSINALQEQLCDQKPVIDQVSIDGLNAELEKRTSEVIELTSTVAELTARNEVAAASSYQMATEREELLNEVERLAQQVSELTEALEEADSLNVATAAASANTADSGEDLESLKLELVDALQSLDNMTEKAAEAGLEADALREELASANQLCGRLQEALSAKESSMVQLQEQLNEKEDIVALIENELFAAKQELALAANASPSISSEELEQLQEQLKSSREEIELLQLAEEELKSELGKAHQLCDDLQASLSTKESAIRKLRLQVDAHLQQLAEKEDIVASIENELFAAKQELELATSASQSTTSEELEQLQRQNDLLRSAEQQLKSELKKSHERLADAEAGLESLRAEMNEVIDVKDKRIAHLDKHKITKEHIEMITKLKEDKKKAQDDNKVMKKQLTELKKVYDQLKESQAESSAAAKPATRSSSRGAGAGAVADNAAEVIELKSQLENSQNIATSLKTKLRDCSKQLQEYETERSAIIDVLMEQGIDMASPDQSGLLNPDCSSLESSNLATAVEKLAEKYLKAKSTIASYTTKSVSSNLHAQKLRDAEEKLASAADEIESLKAQRASLEKRIETMKTASKATRTEVSELTELLESSKLACAQLEADLQASQHLVIQLEQKLEASKDSSEASPEMQALEEENIELMQENKELLRKLSEFKLQAEKAQSQLNKLKGSSGSVAAPDDVQSKKRSFGTELSVQREISTENIVKESPAPKLKKVETESTIKSTVVDKVEVVGIENKSRSRPKAVATKPVVAGGDEAPEEGCAQS